MLYDVSHCLSLTFINMSLYIDCNFDVHIMSRDCKMCICELIYNIHICI